MEISHSEQTCSEAVLCPEGAFSGFLPQGRGCNVGGAGSSVKCLCVNGLLMDMKRKTSEFQIDGNWNSII